MKSAFILSISLMASCGSAKTARTVFMNDLVMAPISLSPGKSVVLSFPTRPTKVILGSQGLFRIEYVENDLAIAPIRPGGRSNLFVYLEGRRFGFELSTGTPGDDVVLVRDASDRKAKVRAKHE